jgi:hypothetical protein
MNFAALAGFLVSELRRLCQAELRLVQALPKSPSLDPLVDWRRAMVEHVTRLAQRVAHLQMVLRSLRISGNTAGLEQLLQQGFGEEMLFPADIPHEGCVSISEVEGYSEIKGYCCVDPRSSRWGFGGAI